MPELISTGHTGFSPDDELRINSALTAALLLLTPLDNDMIVVGCAAATLWAMKTAQDGSNAAIQGAIEATGQMPPLDIAKKFEERNAALTALRNDMAAYIVNLMKSQDAFKAHYGGQPSSPRASSPPSTENG